MAHWAQVMGETVGQEPTSVPGDRGGWVNPTGCKAKQRLFRLAGTETARLPGAGRPLKAAGDGSPR